ALVAVMRSTQAPLETRVLATAGLGLSEHPTAAAMKATTSAIGSTDGEQHSAGALALGNQIREARGAQPDAADEGLRALLAHLDGATTASEVILYLDALGNTGDERALPSISRYLAHEDPSIRAAANGALRFMD